MHYLPDRVIPSYPPLARVIVKTKLKFPALRQEFWFGSSSLRTAAFIYGRLCLCTSRFLNCSRYVKRREIWKLQPVAGGKNVPLESARRRVNPTTTWHWPNGLHDFYYCIVYTRLYLTHQQCICTGSKKLFGVSLNCCEKFSWRNEEVTQDLASPLVTISSLRLSQVTKFRLW